MAEHRDAMAPGCPGGPDDWSASPRQFCCSRPGTGRRAGTAEVILRRHGGLCRKIRQVTSPLIHARTEWSGFLPANTSICLFDVLQFFLVSTLSVHPPLRDRSPDPALGVFDVAGVARDDVDVQVHHRLAGGFAGVHADVVAVGVEPAVEDNRLVIYVLTIGNWKNAYRKY